MEQKVQSFTRVRQAIQKYDNLPIWEQLKSLKRAVVLTGESTTGKTAYLYKLAGKRLKAVNDDCLRRLRPFLEDMDPTIQVGESPESTTSVPNFYYFQQLGLQIVDLPGEGESDIEKKVIHSYYVKKVLESFKQVSFIYMIKGDERGQLATRFVDFIQTLVTSSAESKNALKHSVHICFTQISKDVDVIAWLNQIVTHDKFKQNQFARTVLNAVIENKHTQIFECPQHDDDDQTDTTAGPNILRSINRFWQVKEKSVRFQKIKVEVLNDYATILDKQKPLVQSAFKSILLSVYERYISDEPLIVDDLSFEERQQAVDKLFEKQIGPLVSKCFIYENTENLASQKSHALSNHFVELSLIKQIQKLPKLGNAWAAEIKSFYTSALSLYGQYMVPKKHQETYRKAEIVLLRFLIEFWWINQIRDATDKNSKFNLELMTDTSQIAYKKTYSEILVRLNINTSVSEIKYYQKYLGLHEGNSSSPELEAKKAQASLRLAALASTAKDQKYGSEQIHQLLHTALKSWKGIYNNDSDAFVKAVAQQICYVSANSLISSAAGNKQLLDKRVKQAIQILKIGYFFDKVLKCAQRICDYQTYIKTGAYFGELCEVELARTCFRRAKECAMASGSTYLVTKAQEYTQKIENVDGQQIKQLVVDTDQLLQLLAVHM